MSMALRAKLAMPSGPNHHARSATCRLITCWSRGSRPMSRSLRPSIITSVAWHASAHIVMASPHPTTPSSVSNRHNVTLRNVLLSFGSGYSSVIDSTFVIRLTVYLQMWRGGNDSRH